jgi:hypothetical protein
MELGSPEHKKLLLNGILKTAWKTIFIGLVIAIILIAPRLVIDNQFANFLAVAGLSIFAVTTAYSLWIAFQKYRKTLANF